jgi:hypothetical protein
MRTINIVILLIAVLLIACDQGSINQATFERADAITAAYKLPAVDSLARSYNSGLRLLTVHSPDVHFDGTSAIWMYEYMASTSSVPFIYCFHSTFHSVVFDSVSPLRDGVSFISHTWFNSNVALDIAETNGGYDFRARNPNHFITAFLNQPLVPNAGTYWYVNYRSSKDPSRVNLQIDAVSGKVADYYENRLRD